VLGEATRAGLAVLLAHHQRKAGGGEGDAVRDSSAIVGAVDVLVEIERLGDDSPPGHRRLVAVGRWPKTPPVLVVDRDPATGGWRVVGQAASRSEAASLGIRERVLAMMQDEELLTEAEIITRVGADKRKVGPVLRDLVADGFVARSGAGKRGDPYRYGKVSRKVSSEGDTNSAEKVSSTYREDTFSTEPVSVSVPTADTNDPLAAATPAEIQRARELGAKLDDEDGE